MPILMRSGRPKEYASAENRNECAGVPYCVGQFVRPPVQVPGSTMSKLPPETTSSEITPESGCYTRRSFMRNSALAVGTGAVVGAGLLFLIDKAPLPAQPEQAALAAPVLPPSDDKFTADEAPS